MLYLAHHAGTSMSYAHAAWPEPQVITNLVSDAQRGPTSAINPLLSTLRPALVSFFARRLSHDAAEDLTQAALLRITRALPSIEPDRADRFIVTVACNLLRTAYSQRARDHRRWAPEESAEGIELGTTTAADRHAEYEELARAVHRVCAAELPPKLQEIVLGLLRGETPTEIATRLQLNPVTVRTRLLRARAILRRELEAYIDLPELDAQDCVG